jgi:hypothetical protein
VPKFTSDQPKPDSDPPSFPLCQKYGVGTKCRLTVIEKIIRSKAKRKSQQEYFVKVLTQKLWILFVDGLAGKPKNTPKMSMEKRISSNVSFTALLHISCSVMTFFQAKGKDLESVRDI